MSTDSVFFPNIVGNEALKHRLSKDIAENMLSHAYIIEGQVGSGRHTVALNVAAAIECEVEGGEIDLFGSVKQTKRPCGECASCKKILEGKSPDILIVGLEEDKVTIGVETVRNVKNEMFTAPNDLSVKVFIIEDADKMTSQAQNAFLLSLEEPPEYILFFLLCENSGNLLETVRSRAPIIRTEKLKAEETEGFLLGNSNTASDFEALTEEDRKLLIFLSDGSIGRAIALLDTKTRDRIIEHRKDAETIISLMADKNSAKAFETLVALGNKRNEVSEKLSFLQYALRDLLLLKKDENAPMCFYCNREDALETSTHFTANSLLSLYNAASTARDDLEANSNVKLTLMNMLHNASLI